MYANQIDKRLRHHKLCPPCLQAGSYGRWRIDFVPPTPLPPENRALVAEQTQLMAQKFARPARPEGQAAPTSEGEHGRASSLQEDSPRLMYAFKFEAWKDPLTEVMVDLVRQGKVFTTWNENKGD